MAHYSPPSRRWALTYGSGRAGSSARRPLEDGRLWLTSLVAPCEGPVRRMPGGVPVCTAGVDGDQFVLDLVRGYVGFWHDVTSCRAPRFAALWCGTYVVE